MNKKCLSVFFTLFFLGTIFAQSSTNTTPPPSGDPVDAQQSTNADFVKIIDFKKRTGVVESACNDGCTEISPGLFYKLRKIINFRIPDGVKYEIEFTIKDKDLIFRRTLNPDLTVILDCVKGNSLIKTSNEGTGFFRGTFTITTNEYEIMRGLGLKHVVLKGEKLVIFCVSDDDSFKLLENLKKVQEEGLE